MTNIPTSLNLQTLWGVNWLSDLPPSNPIKVGHNRTIENHFKPRKIFTRVKNDFLQTLVHCSAVTPRNISEYNAAYCSGCFYWGETTFSSLFLWRIIKLSSDLFEIQQRDGAAAWRGRWSSYRNLKCQFTACIYFYIKQDWLKI